ncbi:putative uncharacterized protein [Eubacterium sp. CAG:786]|nr:putative uncharacterized protein [Eubacterium sp. CAG:786]
MDDNSRISLTKPTDGNDTQGWRDPSTGEVYPQAPQASQTAQPQQSVPYQPAGQPYQAPQSAPVQGGYQPQYQQAPQGYQPQYQQPYQPQQGGYQPYQPQMQQPIQGPTKFCKHCGQPIPEKAVICTHCGCQVEEVGNAANNQPIIINNNNNNNNGGGAVYLGRPKNKWVALILCFFLGVFGVHRFYEGKIGTGLIWLFTGGLFGVGVLIDFIILLFKHNPYYV